MLQISVLKYYKNIFMKNILLKPKAGQNANTYKMKILQLLISMSLF